MSITISDNMLEGYISEELKQKSPKADALVLPFKRSEERNDGDKSLVPRFVNSLPYHVVPAQAGIQPQSNIDAQSEMDPRLRGDDNKEANLQDAPLANFISKTSLHRHKAFINSHYPQRIDIQILFLAVYTILLYRYTYSAQLMISCCLTKITNNQPRLLRVLMDPELTFSEHYNVIHNQISQLTCSELLLQDYEANIDSQFCFNCPSLTTTKYADLCISVGGTSFEPSINWQYNPSQYTYEKVHLINENFLIFLHSMLEQPHKKITTYSWLSKDQFNQIVFSWNDTTRNYPSHMTIAQLFEQQCERGPNAIAITFHHDQLTYQQLNSLANHLAHHLIEMNLKKNELIALYFDRSLSLVISLLGTLKAGCAYLTLDRKLPPERVAYQLYDSQVNTVITVEELKHELIDYALNTICIDFFLRNVVKENKINPRVSRCVESLAYINYTSGSTGTPKGVAIKQSSVVNLIFNQTYCALNASSIMLQLAPILFDAFTFELWGPLLQGGQCVLFNYPLPTTQWLRAIIEKNQVNVIFITTALFNTLIDEDPGLFASLHHVLVGGEVLSVQHSLKALNHLPNTQLVNMYGPTECTTFSTFYLLNHLNHPQHSIPIGRPISNTRAYILDKFLNPLPVGVIGELYIGGSGLSTGYVNQPELTQEKFIRYVPFLAADDQLYKTGDLACYLPNGCIEYIGRTDHQVKIHGFRIEPEEIESLLKTHPLINNAVVIVSGDSYDTKILRAFFVPHNERLHPDELAQYLRQKLPHYMIPETFVQVDMLPLTPNGKIDRKVLQQNLFSHGTPS